MTDYTIAEQTHIEALKEWWKRYGTAVMLAVLIVLSIWLGWQYWQRMQTREFAQASLRYEELLNSIEQQQTAEAMQRAQDLITQYPKLDYAKLGAFFLAQQAVANNDFPKAAEKLRWVMDTAKTVSLKQIARIRLARVLVAEKKAQEALTVLQTVDDPVYIPEIEAIKADVYVALGKIPEAKKAYTQALKQLPKTAALHPLLQMKLENLP